MSIKRKWLRAIFLVMLAGASSFGGINPKDIDDTLRIMNETKVEFTIPDESGKGDGYRSLLRIDPVELKDSPPDEEERSGGNTSRG
ncbi:MAG: hypothetical protein WBE86_11320 [Candidatus Acidiferrales bacterium]